MNSKMIEYLYMDVKYQWCLMLNARKSCHCMFISVITLAQSIHELYAHTHTQKSNNKNLNLLLTR